MHVQRAQFHILVMMEKKQLLAVDVKVDVVTDISTRTKIQAVADPFIHTVSSEMFREVHHEQTEK